MDDIELALKEFPEQRIENWFEDALQGGTWFNPTDKMEERLQYAFKDVLLRFNQEELSRFLDINPIIFHQRTYNHACVTCLHVAPNPTEETGLTKVPILYLSPGVEEETDEQLRNILAHEIAHLLLGHLEEVGMEEVVDPPEEREKAADALAVTWGFAPGYGPDGKVCL